METLFYAGNKALHLVIALSTIPVAVATCIGVTVALFQAITHLQDQTLAFGVKMLGVFYAIYVSSGWMGDNLVRFSDDIFRMAFP